MNFVVCFLLRPPCWSSWEKWIYCEYVQNVVCLSFTPQLLFQYHYPASPASPITHLFPLYSHVQIHALIIMHFYSRVEGSQFFALKIILHNDKNHLQKDGDDGGRNRNRTSMRLKIKISNSLNSKKFVILLRKLWKCQTNFSKRKAFFPV